MHTRATFLKTNSSNVLGWSVLKWLRKFFLDNIGMSVSFYIVSYIRIKNFYLSVYK
jgi:hypothetical protein